MAEPTEQPPSASAPAPPAEDEYHLDRDRIRAELAESQRSPLRWRLSPGKAPDSTYEEESAWVLTYIDILTLLLTMFVVMLAYAKTDAERYRELSEAVSAEMGQELPFIEVPRAPEMQLAEQIGENIRRQGMLESVDVLTAAGKVELRIRENILFESGQAELRPAGRAVLDQLLPLLRAEGRDITVEGHTDNVPISTERFPSNWELSAARAAIVVRHLIGAGFPPERLSAVGHADTRPLTDNTTAEGRARNRRVALIIGVAAEAP